MKKKTSYQTIDQQKCVKELGLGFDCHNRKEI